MLLKQEDYKHWEPTFFIEHKQFNSPNAIATSPIFIGHKSYYRYPAMTAPVANTAKSIVAPTNHIEALTEFIKQCHKIVIIGSSGIDQDVFDVLEPMTEIEYAAIVGFGTDVNKMLENYSDGLANSWNVTEPITYGDGFWSFLGSGTFAQLLSA